MAHALTIEFESLPRTAGCGRQGEAANGGLWIVVGGAKEDFEAARVVLEPISETLHYMGPATSGNKMKLVGNLCVGAQLQSLGDALTLAAKAGLNPADVVGVLDVTDFKTPIYAGVGRAVLGSLLGRQARRASKRLEIVARLSAGGQGAP